jgi:tetratricopeptide (TPR) repeat protein
MVLATPERLAIDHDELSARLAPEWGPSGLAEYGIGDTDKFLSYLLLGEDELATALAGFTTLNTDDLPHAQFRTEGHLEGVRTFLDLMEHQRSAAVYLVGETPPDRAARLEAYRSMSRRLNLGFLMNNRGEYEEARAVAQAAGFYPDQNVRSTLMYDQKRKEYFLDRIETHETDANAHNTLGYIYWREGLLDDAIRELTRATDLNPDFVNAYATLARVFADAGRFDEAEATWLAVRERNPAGSVLSMARRELRIVYLRRRLSYEPDSPSLNLLLGEIYVRAGRNVEAAEILRAAAIANPGNLEIHIKLSGLYENLEFVEDALETYRALALLRPGDERMTLKVQEFETMARDPDARQRWISSTEFVLSEGGRDGAGHSEACREASELWNEFPFEGRIEADALRRAAELYEEAAVSRSDDVHVYADAARIYEVLGEYGPAASVWQKALALDPDDRRAGDHVRRLELLQLLEESGPDAGSAGGWIEIGRLYRRDGEVADATEYFRRAVRADPRNTQARSDLVGAHLAAGRYPQAIETLEEGLALQPDPRDAAAMTERLRRLRDLAGQ